jgi:hypothetical protein
MRAVAWVMVAGCSFRPHHGSSDAAIDAPSDWWDPTWPTRIQLTIANGADAPLAAGFQVGFQLDLEAGPCAGPRDAVRVARGTTEVPRAIDEVGPHAEWLWFRLVADVATMSTEYYLYCGNPMPPPPTGDPKSVFDFYDDFPGTQLAATWQQQGTVTVSGGAVTIGGGFVVDSGIYSNPTFAAHHAVDYVAQVADATAPDFWAGFQYQFPDQCPWIHWYAHVANSIQPDYCNGPTAASWYGTEQPLAAEATWFGVENYGDSSMYRIGDVPIDRYTYTAPPSPSALNVRLHNYSDTNAVAYHLVRVRQAVKPPPTVTVGAPQPY